MGKRATQLRTQMTAISFAGVFLICFLIALMAGETTKRALVNRAERDAGAMLAQVIRNLEYTWRTWKNGALSMCSPPCCGCWSTTRLRPTQ
jgi:hypothetical protein